MVFMSETAASARPRRKPGGRAGVVAAVVTTALVLVTVLGIARGDPVWTVESAAPAWLAVLGLASLSALAAAVWAVHAERPRAATGLAVAAAGSLPPLWAGWSLLPGMMRGAVLASVSLAVVGAADVALRWREPEPRSLALRVVYVLGVVSALVHVVGYDAFEDPTCARTCADIRPVARDLLTTRAAVAVSCLATIVAAVIAAVAVWRARPRVPDVIVAGALVTVASVATASATRWARWEATSPWDALVVVPAITVGAVLGGAVCVVSARTRRSRVAVDRLVTRLSEPGTLWRDTGGAVRAVHFAVPGEDRWVDATGRDVVEVLTASESVVMSDRSGPVLRLALARKLDPIDVLAGLAPATRVALRNAQLAAVVHARLAEVRASRRRVVAVSDAERLRIERDLHDGAQQRLVSAAFYLTVARNRLPDTSPQLARTQEAVRDALDALRRLAHGIFPSVLATEGLRVALEDFVSTCDIPATLEVDGGERIDLDTAMAAYATVVAAVDLVGADSIAAWARISVVENKHGLRIRIETSDHDGAGSASDLTDVADRVSAVGGEFTVSSIHNERTVTAVLPCAS